MASREQIIMSWQAPEFRHYPKNFAWYLTLYIIATFIIGFLIIQRDIFGAISILILTVFIVIFSQQRPRNVEVTITNKGIALDETYIPNSTIKHYWVVDTTTHQTLNLETTSYLNRTVIIQLAGVDPDDLRDTLGELLQHHPDEEASETLAQRVMHTLRF